MLDLSLIVGLINGTKINSLKNVEARISIKNNNTNKIIITRTTS
jgi:hypothetical protein